jgi:REP element-mobilizing transposase RayT
MPDTYKGGKALAHSAIASRRLNKPCTTPPSGATSANARLPAQLRSALRSVRRRRPFHIDGWVVLPNHTHCIWTLPPGDVDFPGRWYVIKSAFSKSIPVTQRRSSKMLRRGERGIWQHR